MKSDRHMDNRSSIANGNGKDRGPMIADALSPEEIEAIEKLASGASEGARCAEAGLLGEAEAVEAMVAKLTKQSTARPWLVYREIDGEPDVNDEAAAVLLGYFGNGPEAEANARFFAIARSCVFALLVHVRKLERERAFLGEQVDRLARCLLDHHAGEIGKGGSEGAVDVAVRLLTPIKVDMEET